MKLGRATAVSVETIPGYLFTIGKSVYCYSINSPYGVVTEYYIDPSAGLKDGGLVILVSSRSINEFSGILLSLRFLLLPYASSAIDSDCSSRFLYFLSWFPSISTVILVVVSYWLILHFMSSLNQYDSPTHFDTSVNLTGHGRTSTIESPGVKKLAGLIVNV